MLKPVIAFWKRWFGWRPRPKRWERRTTSRRPGSLATSCHLSATVQAEPQAVRVRNLSATGISLVVERDYAPDTLLTIQLINSNRLSTCTLPVRVVYTVPHPSGEWIIGGAFTRKLLEEELQVFLM